MTTITTTTTSTVRDVGGIPAGAVADRIAALLTAPQQTLRRCPPPPWWRQSLARGALGITLLHVERARTGDAPWRPARTWLRHVTSGPIDDGPGSHLHYGAPALGYVLHRAATGVAGDGRGARALAALDTRIAHATRTRLDRAHRRIDSGRGPSLAEFDAIRGLTGLGAYWLTRLGHHDDADGLVAAVATYLVRLTEPLPAHRLGAGSPPHGDLPGWWTPLAPSGRPSPAFPDGHINHGVSHGIGGPLALLALTATAGIRLPGHETAIARIRRWLDTHRHHDATSTWWPYWTTPTPSTAPAAPAEPGGAAGATTRGRQGRPSWCYGSPGLARAHQLAGIALHDRELHDLGAHVLGAVAVDDGLRQRLDDSSLCHGHAGLLHLVTRAAATPVTPHPATTATVRPARTTTATDTRAVPASLHAAAVGAAELQLRAPLPALGLLDGLSGIALALGAHDGQIEPGWDRCLLIS